MFIKVARWELGSWQQKVWFASLFAFMVLAGAFLGCNRPRGLPSDALMAGKVAADGTPYYGKTIRVYGYVSNTSGAGVFSISDGVGGTASLPILVKSDGFAVNVGELVLVEGTPTAYDSGRVRQDYRIDLPPETARGWENRPVLIAVKMRKLD
ncbi:hypothetical protein GMST_15010 [Geomonas silvestris]|uniref:Lipoprotein n=1 Tax=Geomonas silvestris TaxID=2740184 RepID=A0A6V8MGR0_9BACT|nr:hypothetical protein [Geomonas silvestris]GFO59176.1 hypothetical protein GMST_15010 [Geomonas silvestris]